MRRTITCSNMSPMESADVVVVGAGAAGMTAALTAARQGLDTVLIEKADRYGGSTARSGGGLWGANNDVLNRDGVAHTPEQAAGYLAHITGAEVGDDRRRAFLAAGPAMVRFVLANTPLRLRWVTGYSDYYPEAPGGKPQGRSIEPRPMDARAIEDIDTLAEPYLRAPTGMAVTQADYRWMNLMARHPRGLARTARVATRRLVS